MLKLALAVAMTATPVLSQDMSVSEGCLAASELAYSVMEIRQTGVPLLVLMSTLDSDYPPGEARETTRALVMMAYAEEPYWPTLDLQMLAAETFSENFYIDCMIANSK